MVFNGWREREPIEQIYLNERGRLARVRFNKFVNVCRVFPPLTNGRLIHLQLNYHAIARDGSANVFVKGSNWDTSDFLKYLKLTYVVINCQLMSRPIRFPTIISPNVPSQEIVDTSISM